MLRDLFSDLRFRLRVMFRRDDVERELADEFQLHIDVETDRLVREGLPIDEARRQARISFGSVEQVKEETREARGLTWLDSVAQDLRYAVRSLRRSSGFAAAVVVTIALGLGANVALFSVIDRLMLRPPAYLRDPARVNRVALYSLLLGRRDIPELWMPQARYTNIERTAHSFDRIAGFLLGAASVGTGAAAQREVIGAVTGSYFDFFDARPVQGRFITSADIVGPTHVPIVVLSYAYWRDHLGAHADVVGTTISIDSVLRTIIGVAPPNFVGIPDDRTPALWIPVPPTFRSRISMIVHRKPRVSEAVASADLSHAFLDSYQAERAVSPRMVPIDVARPSAATVSLHEMLRPNAPAEARLYPWLGAVGLIVLLIACANVANLLLARALRRRREVSVRLALGVSRGRLLTQLLTESVLLAVMGGVGALFAAQWGAAVLRSLLSSQNVVSSLTIADRSATASGDTAVVTDGRTLLFVSGAVLVVGILSGLAPAVYAMRQDLTGSLKSGVRDGSYQRSRTRNALLVSQVALCAVMLVGAGLFIRSVGHVRDVRLGYDIDPILTANINMKGTRIDDSASTALMHRLEAELATIPGVTRTAQASTFSGWIAYDQLSVPNVNTTDGQFLQLTVGPGYFATMGTRILLGRAFAVTDRADAEFVAIVSQTMAHTLWPNQTAVGRCIRVGADTAPCRTVVGVAEDIKQKSFVGDPGLQYYLPVAQHSGDADASLVVRADGDARRYAETVRRRLQRVMPGTSEISVTSLRDMIDSKMRQWRLGATLFLAFGGLALVVAAVGLFAVISYNVEQRSHDLGVRIAFGAETGDVLRLVVGQAMQFAAIGITIGVTISLGAGRWMRPVLFEESPGDPAVHTTVALIVCTVALAASAIPALHAARTDPNVVLRNE